MVPFGDSSKGIAKGPILSSVSPCDCKGIISISGSLSQSTNVVQVVNPSKTVPKSVKDVLFFFFLDFFFSQTTGQGTQGDIWAACNHGTDFSFNAICKLSEFGCKLVRFLLLLIAPGGLTHAAKWGESKKLKVYT